MYYNDLKSFRKKQREFYFLQFVFVVIFLIITFGTLYLSFENQSKTDIVKDCKVIELQQQTLVSGDKDNIRTEIRYLVITDKETFVCESSWLNGKFNNSDIFYRLKQDSLYSFKVAGQGKSLLYDYRNILEIIK